MDQALKKYGRGLLDVQGTTGWARMGETPPPPSEGGGFIMVGGAYTRSGNAMLS